MHKKSLPKNQQDITNSAIFTDHDQASTILTVLSEQPDNFSLFATSFSLTLSHDPSSSSFTASPTSPVAPTNQPIIFSGSATPQDNSILTIASCPKKLDKFLKHISFDEQDAVEEMLKKIII